MTLLNIPGFIERLCKLATRKVSEAPGASSFLQELEDWYSWLDNVVVLDAFMLMATDEAELSSTGSTLVWLHSGLHLSRPLYGSVFFPPKTEVVLECIRNYIYGENVKYSKIILRILKGHRPLFICRCL